MTVIQMSQRELTRLRVLIDLSDRRLTVEAAGGLVGVGRRQVYRVCGTPLPLMVRWPWFHASAVARAITAAVRHSVEPF